MEKVNICIIKPNKFNISKLPKLNEKKKNIKDEPFNLNDFDKKLNYADLKKFKEITNDFIEIKEIETNKIMVEIENSINSCADYVNVTEDIFEARNSLYQMCFMDKYHDKCNESDLNYVASALTSQEKAIVGSTVILKEAVIEDSKETKLINIELEDIYYLIYSEIIHAGVIIKENNKIEQIYFNNNLNLVNLDKNNTINNFEINYLKDSNYEGYRETILKFDLNIYVRKSSTYENSEVKINPIASKIYNMRIDGDSIFICKNLENNKYYDLFVEDITDILKIDISKRRLTKDELEPKKNKDNTEIFNGRYRLLYNKLNN